MKFRVPRSAFRVAPWLGLLFPLLLCGCATSPPKGCGTGRTFVFKQDTFAFANDLVWEYRIDPATGRTTHTPRQPPATYSHHCFVVARAARQFFQNARFDPSQPAADDATYRRLIRRVMSTSPRRELPEEKKIVIPGFTNLYTFSQAHEALLKAECGGAWRSYFQLGHWRMIFPFSERHQEKAARRLATAAKEDRPPIVHLVRFPSLTINHAVVLFDAQETENEILFTIYDPNTPEKSGQLIYDRKQRRFRLPANLYFAGGRVDVYEIYCGWCY